MSEWPYDEPPTAQLQAEAEVDRLHAEVNRLRADLADAQRRIDTVLTWHRPVEYPTGLRCYSDGQPHPCPTVRALSAGGGGTHEFGARCDEIGCKALRADPIHTESAGGGGPTGDKP